MIKAKTDSDLERISTNKHIINEISKINKQNKN